MDIDELSKEWAIKKFYDDVCLLCCFIYKTIKHLTFTYF